MIYKNSIKLMMSNYRLITRLLIHMLIYTAIIFGLAYVLAIPTFRLLSSNGIIDLFKDIYNSLFTKLNISQLAIDLGNALKGGVDVIINNFSSISASFIGCLAVVTLFGSLLISSFNMIISNCLYYYMSDHVKYGYMPSFVETLTLNFKYTLTSFFIKLPVNIILILTLWQSLRLLQVGGAVTFFAPFIIMLLYLMLRSFKTTLFSAWVPAILSFNNGVATSLNRGFAITFREWKKTFANAFYMTLTLVVINLFAGLVTFGVALIITIPSTFLLSSCFSMVVFYSNHGRRYYVDEFNVIVPRKMERTELMSDIRFVI